MRVIGLAGWSGAGKTTLLVKLIPALRQRGLAVSTVKHAHHGLEVDRPGKDSFMHREAGAREVLVASARRWALVHELREEAEPRLAELLRRLSRVDLVIVEGFKAEAHPKIEIHRTANGKPFLFPDIPNVRAIATDAPVPGSPVPVIDLNDPIGVADRMLGIADPIETVVAILASEPRPARPIAPPQLGTEDQR
jgi:molybdopterin-guanine dinucleotide biosynthesis protein B